MDVAPPFSVKSCPLSVPNPTSYRPPRGIVPSPIFVGPSLAPSQPSLLSGLTQSWEKPWALRNQAPPLLDFPSRVKPRPSLFERSPCGCLLSRHTIFLRKRLFPAQSQTYFSQMKHLLKFCCSVQSEALPFSPKPGLDGQLGSPLPGPCLNPGPNVGRTEGDILRCEAPLQNPADSFF